MILAGRILKPNESELNSLIIKEGYSFLSSQEETIYFNELENYNIYSDLNLELLPDSLSFLSIKAVDDIYNYLEQGIVITSWDNTDYSRASIVHVLEENGERSEISRRPTIYCPNLCGSEAQELAILITN